MARKAARTNAKPAQKLNSIPLLIGRVLIAVGKPFYLTLSAIFIGLLFLLAFIGSLVRSIVTSPVSFANYLVKINRTLGVRARSVKLPKFPVKNYPLILKSFLTSKLKGLKLKKRPRRVKKIIYRAPKLKLKKGSIVLLIFVFSLLWSYWYFILRGLPSPEELITRSQEVSTKIYDRNGVLLYNIYKDQNRTIVPLEDIPVQVRLATLAAEDAEFYSHPGFSIRGIFRAVVRNVSRGELSGGSTITQQLVKNALLTSEKTVVRKIREIILALKVERAFTKDEILEMYLNEVSYGGTAYGIEAASEIYFGKDVAKLTLAEAALLAGLPKSPTTFSPFGPSPEEGIARQRDVLYLMRINKFITQEQEEKALAQRLTFAPNRANIKAPHFVMYVRQLLEEKYGSELVEQGGLEVITTLDYEIQQLAEKAVREEVERLSSLNVGNGAALVLNPQTGEILAMVGSKDYFATDEDGNVNVTTSLRQPGSSIKVVNYAYALSNGMTPATIINDSPVTFVTLGSDPYSPKNYDDKYRGNITLRSALAESRNIPAVKVLATYGVTKMIELGQRMGITTWDDPSRFGLSLTLGGGEVKLIDLARVYATVANYGKRPEITTVKKITNYKGKTLEEDKCLREKSSMGKLVKDLFQKQVLAAEAAKNPCEGEEILSPAVSFQLISILSDNIARSPAFGGYSLLVIPGHSEVAVKTGTSNNLRDNLAIGFNKEYLVATWVGNNDNSPMARVASGITGATPIFHNIMSPLLAGKEATAWEVPAGVEKVGICTITGTLSCTSCPTKEEWFLEGTAPKTHCSLETIQKIQEERERNREGQITPEAASTNR